MKNVFAFATHGTRRERDEMNRADFVLSDETFSRESDFSFSLMSERIWNINCNYEAITILGSLIASSSVW